jgi:hypothetical protein
MINSSGWAAMVLTVVALFELRSIKYILINASSFPQRPVIPSSPGTAPPPVERHLAGLAGAPKVRLGILIPRRRNGAP